MIILKIIGAIILFNFLLFTYMLYRSKDKPRGSFDYAMVDELEEKEEAK